MVSLGIECGSIVRVLVLPVKLALVAARRTWYVPGERPVTEVPVTPVQVDAVLDLYCIEAVTPVMLPSLFVGPQCTAAGAVGAAGRAGIGKDWAGLLDVVVPLPGFMMFTVVPIHVGSML